jgi:hypothetical protein
MIKQTYMDFGLNEGILLKQRGMSLAAGSYQMEEWEPAAFAWLMSKPKGYRFSMDDVAFQVGLPAHPDEGYKNNGFSSWPARMAEKGYLMKTAVRIKSRRKSNHGHEISVWEKIV